MKRLNHKLRKGLALLLTLAMVAGIIPSLPGGANEVKAATGSGTGNTPSVSAFATKTQLMNAFNPGEDGTAANYGKLVFGNKEVEEDGSYTYVSQEWYILGKDTGVSGDNTIIFAASPIATGQQFNSSTDIKDFDSSFGVYASNPTAVYPNHYGASNLRAALQTMATNASYFTSAEQGLMNATTVTTQDTKNSSVTYTTTDKLYALAADGSGSTTLKAGTNNQTVLAMNSYWSSGDRFWLRSPSNNGNGGFLEALYANPGNKALYGALVIEYNVRPASNLNLSKVLFASSAKAASSDTAESRTIADGTAMTLRLDGIGKNIGLVTYNTTTGDIKVDKVSTTSDVALVVQGNDGTNDWYYSKKIGANQTINVSDIKSGIDLSVCKIWLETTDADGLIYAVGADKEIETINTTYVTKEQLMNSFKPYSDGTVVNIGKLVFGKKSDGTTPQEWYILGKDSGVSGDNTIIFATSPIATNQVFEDNRSVKTDTSLWSDCDYNGVRITEVYSNHYGASDLRNVLQQMANGSATTYFTTAEQGLMNPTTVTTKDTRNGVTYTTTDKLYALQGDFNAPNGQKLWAGTSDSTVLAMNSYWNSGDWFWLRSPYVWSGTGALLAYPGNSVFQLYSVVNDYAVQPASNLNLSSVLFASAATAASSDTKSEKITDGTAMTLRLDGTGRNIGAAIYNAETGTIEVRRGSTSQTVALVVQGNDGTNDWYYSKKIDASETINVSAISSETYTPASIDLSACKIWLEITDTDGLIYAVNAEKEIEKINTTYVTKEQLMNSFKPYSDGTATNYGKLVFGNNSSGGAQEWYILGKDTGVSGDNTIIFAASPIVTGQVFEDNTSVKTDTSLWSDCDYNGVRITEVYPNHYGASDLRVALHSMFTDTIYFTLAEQGLMNDTIVTTKDTKNGVTYTTTDKLYALATDGDRSTTIKAGTNDQTVLATSKYWSSGDKFWLRSPNDYGSNAMFARPGDFVRLGELFHGLPVQPASNLNLSSVLFASSATAASSETAEVSTIADGTAMTLRLDGSSKNIGTVSYNTTTGNITATKGSTEGNVALVVQGRGTVYGVEKDWYYSKRITGTETVNVSAIVSETNTPSSINLSDCNIWLETTDSTDRMTYAVGATVSIISVAITGFNPPAANTALSTSASCATEGVSSTTPQITWTPSDSTAGYNTSYTASITLTADTGYEFINSTTATVLGNTATSVNKNADGTLTVTYVFSATAKRKIVSVAPAVPTDNTFTTYYGYEGYDEVLSDVGNSELGTQATVTFEETVAPTTADIDVTWSIANADDAPYDKTPGAENIFRWTIPATALTNYDASVCQGYDADTGNITGTVTITNKAATPVNITGTDSGIRYTGATIDVSDYFDIDTNAGAATYSLVTGADGRTGEGSLDGTTLTVTKTGTFQIKVETAAIGIYAAGEKIITLTVSNGTIEYTATDYSGTYDGQAHSIRMNVTNPEGTTVTYSTDGTTYGSDNPSFTNAGIYTVYYRIAKDNYTTIEASKTVTINKKSVTITAEEQNIIWGNAIDQSDYSVSADGLATGDTISELTLTPSTTALTENGKISISGVKMENASGADVTGSYDIATVDGTLKIAHNTALAPERIEAVKTKTTYTAGESLNVDDITVTAYYTDSYSEEVTGFTTNASDIDMSKVGDKTLTVSYTKNGETKTKDITIIVSKKDINAPYIKDDNGKEGWDVILGEVKKAKNKDKVIVDMNGTSIVPGNVLDEIKGKDITIVLDMGNGITWSINGQSITTGNVGNIDFTVKTGTKSIPVDIINNVTGERSNIQISLNHSGDFGFTAVLSVNVDKKNAGLYANLFYYNETTGKMDFICADKIAEDGIAELNFTHASDYAIVIDTEPMDGNAPDTGDKTPVAPLLALIIATGLMAVTFRKKKKFIVKD